MRFLLLVAILAMAPTAHAQDLAAAEPTAAAGELPAPTLAERRLIELVTKVSFNEANDNYQDLALIWQVTEGHGETPEERYRWLRAHSRCVSGVLTQDQAYARSGNCHWTRNLMPDGRRPRGFHECHDRDHDGEPDIEPGHSAAHPCDGNWHRLRPRFFAHLRSVRRFVLGADPYRPCERLPVTWDGRRWQESAERRGWREAGCVVGAANVGYIRS